jgi:hypothetical protein
MTLVSAQTKSAKEISLPADYDAAKDTYKARDIVEILPGFDFTASTGNELSLEIDETMVFDVDYVPDNSVVNPDTRTINTSLPVGTTTGSGGVSPMGAATYSIPIFTPPGTQGMVPGVSINYSSQSGNGVVGYGWHIGGMSAITRTGRTIYHVGHNRAVNYDEYDQLLLDGNRLIVYNGTHGTDGCEYRTEVESFQKITFHGTLNAASSFTVLTKSGLTIEYGNTDDSKVNLPYKSQIMTWRINKITDLPRSDRKRGFPDPFSHRE